MQRVPEMLEGTGATAWISAVIVGFADFFGAASLEVAQHIVVIIAAIGGLALNAAGLVLKHRERKRNSNPEE